MEPLRDLLPHVRRRTAPASRSSWWCPHLPVVPVLESVHTVGGSGFTTMDDDDLARFRPLPELRGAGRPVPAASTSTRAPDTLNQPPAEVLPRLTAAGRSPLTIAEGLAVLVSDPGVLRGRNCFSLLGSRAGDKRVPALWVSARRPRLGWCYQGAPHTWLGSASCAGAARRTSRRA